MTSPWCFFFGLSCCSYVIVPGGFWWFIYLYSSGFHHQHSALPQCHCRLISTTTQNDKTPTPDDVINWKKIRVTDPLWGEFTGHRWIPLTKGQKRRALMFSLICAWRNGWANHRDAGDLRHDGAHYDVNVMHVHISWIYCSLMHLSVAWYSPYLL